MTRVSHYALLCGLSAFVPLPWVDGWCERRARRSLYAEIARSMEIPLELDVLTVLTEDRSSLVLGCLGAAVIWPLKKLLRTIFFIFLVKDCVDGVTRAGLCAAMLESALKRGVLPGRASEVRAAMDAALDRFQWSPVSRTLMRRERPEAPWIHAGDPVTGMVGALYRHGGGGLVLADFNARTAVE